MKRGISSDPFQCKPEIALFKVIFLFQMTYFQIGGTLWVRLNMEISKSAVLLANEHQDDQKNCYKWFSHKFSLCISSHKNDSVKGMSENVASRRILTKMAASVFHRIWSNIQKIWQVLITNIWIFTTRINRLKTSLDHVVICFWKHCFISYRSVLKNPILKVACVN